MVNQLREKFHSIISGYHKLKAEKEQLLREKQELAEKLKQKEKECIEIEQKFGQVTISNLLVAGSKDAREAKQKVNLIVREIDKCIALLNR